MIRYEGPVDEYLWQDLGLCTAGTRVEVELRGAAAFVRLLDADHYQAYPGGEYTYYGGVWEVSPFVLDVPYDDHGYLVVDGYEGKITIRVTTIPG